MPAKTEKNELVAELAAVDALLASAPEDDPLGRRSLAARKEVLLEELAMLDASPRHAAHAALYFGGAPVAGGRGIDAAFAAKALASYEDLVTKVWGHRQHGMLPASGPVRDRRDATLHITGVVRGSFGFELTELDPPSSADGAPLREAVNVATRAIVAAGDSDDALADAAEGLEARAFLALREFFTLLKKRGASVRVVSDELDRSFDVSAVAAAADRTQGTLSEEHDVPVSGEFLGVLPERRTFEFRRDDGTVLHGRVSDELALAEVRELNERWSTRRCVAHLRVVTLTARARSRQRYVLRRVAEISP